MYDISVINSRLAFVLRKQFGRADIFTYLLPVKLTEVLGAVWSKIAVQVLLDPCKGSQDPFALTLALYAWENDEIEFEGCVISRERQVGSKGNYYNYRLKNSSGSWAISGVTYDWAMRAILAQWDMGGRELLLSLLNDRIMYELMWIETDLKQAILIVGDGSVLFYPDRVIIVRKDGSLPTFAGKEFVMGQIQGHVRRVSFKKAWGTADVQYAISLVKNGKEEAVYCNPMGWKENSDLVVSEEVFRILPETSGTLTRDIV